MTATHCALHKHTQTERIWLYKLGPVGLTPFAEPMRIANNAALAAVMIVWMCDVILMLGVRGH